MMGHISCNTAKTHVIFYLLPVKHYILYSIFRQRIIAIYYKEQLSSSLLHPSVNGPVLPSIHLPYIIYGKFPEFRTSHP